MASSGFSGLRAGLRPTVIDTNSDEVTKTHDIRDSAPVPARGTDPGSEAVNCGFQFEFPLPEPAPISIRWTTARGARG